MIDFYLFCWLFIIMLLVLVFQKKWFYYIFGFRINVKTTLIYWLELLL